MVPAPPKPLFNANLDITNATFSGSDVQRQIANTAAQANAAIDANVAAAKAAAAKTLASTSRSFRIGLYILGAIGLILLGIVLYDAFAPDSWPNIFFDKAAKGLDSGSAPPSSSGGDKSEEKKKPVSQSKPPPLLQKYWHAVFGNSSGNLAPAFHDATQQTSIKSTEAPLSAQREGGYGMQWWMYVKDWNYGYGKKKAVVRRPDGSNGSIMNPEISLHPTDNSLQISVSVYPSKDGST
jgi:hypothetical protein